MKMFSVKKIVLNLTTAVLLIVGSTNVTVPTVKEAIYPDSNKGTTYYQKETTEGEVQLALGSLIALLSGFLSKGEKVETEVHETVIVSRNSIIKKESEYIGSYFNKYESDFQDIIRNELDEPFKSSYNIRDVDFQIKQNNRLKIIVTAEIPKLRDDKSYDFKKLIKKKISELLEDKVEHINSFIAEHPGITTQKSIEFAFDEEMEKVKNGIKILRSI